MYKLLVVLFSSTFLLFGIGMQTCLGENINAQSFKSMTANTNPPTNTPESNTDDYIPGVTPWHKPTEAELGFKPLSNTEFEKVKKHAAETRDERWSALEPNKTTEEFDRDLAIETDQLHKFENDYSDPPFQNTDVDQMPTQPIFTWNLDSVGHFFRKIFGK